MKVLKKGALLELAEKKDSADVLLGVMLFAFTLLFFLAAPLAFTQQWSYRFGAVSKTHQVLVALLASFIGLVCLAGAYYNIFKNTVYSFNPDANVFKVNDSVRTIDAVTGIITSSRMLPAGRMRYWVGLQLISQEKLFFSEYFERKEEALKIIAVLTAHTGLKLLDKEF